MKNGLTAESKIREALPLSLEGDVVHAQARAIKQARQLTIGLTLFSLVVLILAIRESSYREQCLTTIDFLRSAIQCTCINDYLLSPWLYGSFLLALLFEKIAPARAFKNEGSLSFYAGFDFLWSLPKLLFFATVWPLFTMALQVVYDKHLSFLTIHVFDATPWFFRFMLGLLIADFAHWGSHLLRHKVSKYWEFHSIHHAQRHLNFFTEYRSHIIDDLLKLVLEALPLFMLQHNFVQVLLVNQLRYWHSALYHANIKSNYGFLRYILVTPQSHRVHHSLEPRHADKNFGLTFSIWDHLFGTQYRNYDEYPETGISSPSYEVEDKETSAGKLGLIRPFLAQFFFPFRFSAFKEEVCGRVQFFPALTSVRFLLAIGVVSIHYNSLILPGLTSVEFKQGAVTNLVPGFFCLAGFILASQYKDFKGLSCLYRYFSARMARILPLYWFTLFLALAIGPLICLCPDLSQFPAFCFYNFALLQAWCPDPIFYYGLNPPAYSLSMEVFYYLLFPLLFFLGKRSFFPALFFGQLLMEYLIFWLGPLESRVYTTSVAPLSHFSDFMVGFAAAGIFEKITLNPNPGKKAFFLCSALEILCVAAFFLWPLYSIKVFDLSWGPILGLAVLVRRVGSMFFFALLCCLLAWRRGFLSKLLARPGFVYLGELTYSIFLLHQIFIRGIVFHSINLKALGAPGFLGFFAIVIGLSALTFRFVETPWRRTLLDFSRQVIGPGNRARGNFSEVFFSFFQGKGRQFVALLTPFLLLAVFSGLVAKKETLLSFGRDFLLPAVGKPVVGSGGDTSGDTGIGWFLLSGSENISFGNSARLVKIMAHVNEDQSLSLVAHWRGEKEPERSRYVGVHLLNGKGQIVHQLDHVLVSSIAMVSENSLWYDKFTISASQLQNVTTLGLAVFADPQQTYLISGGKCDWGNHRLLIALPASEKSTKSLH